MYRETRGKQAGYSSLPRFDFTNSLFERIALPAGGGVGEAALAESVRAQN